MAYPVLVVQVQIPLGDVLVPPGLVDPRPLGRVGLQAQFLTARR
ncbi:hypothetical protein [Streptomyces mirabilis]